MSTNTNTGNTFNIETLKGYTRTTSANRVSAVQMIASGLSGKDCRANAVEAYNTCKELVGVDKGTVSIYKALSEMPAGVWGRFPLAQQDTTEGVKQANQLVRLAQAFTLCNESGVGYGAGWKAGVENAAADTNTNTTATTTTAEG